MKKNNLIELSKLYPKEIFEPIYMDYSKIKKEIARNLNISIDKLNIIANMYNLKRDNRLMIANRKDTFTETINRIDKEYFEDLFCHKLLGIKEIGAILGVCEEVVNKIAKYYNLTRDRGALMSAIITKSNNYDKDFQEALNRISKEDIIKYYIEEDHSWEEAAEYFNIKQSMFDKIKLYYGIKKDFSLCMHKKLEAKYKEYGSKEAYIKHLKEKSKETLISKYGSEENIPDFLNIKNSKPNIEFKNILESFKINFVREFGVETKIFDFKIDNVLIEINPTYTHNSTWNHYNDEGIPKDYHYRKSQIAFNNNYNCVHIFDWDDKNKIANSFIFKNPIYARKCNIKEIDKKCCDDFLNRYHFQNTCRGQNIKLGLYYNNELIQIMTFGKPRYNKNYEWELLRLCTKFGYKVIGGAEKLFKYFIKNYNPKSIISYCDNSKFKGDVYNRLSMKFLRFNKPTKHWYNEKLNIHITHNLLSQRGFDQLLGDKFGVYGKGIRNEDLMLSHGFVVIYDCGQSTYVWRNRNDKEK